MVPCKWRPCWWHVKSSNVVETVIDAMQMSCLHGQQTLNKNNDDDDDVAVEDI